MAPFVHIRTSADLLAIPPRFDVSTWDIGRSGDLGGGVEVWTSWLPTYGAFETLVVDRDGILREYVEDSQTRTKDEALAQHTRTVQRVRDVLVGQGVV